MAGVSASAAAEILVDDLGAPDGLQGAVRSSAGRGVRSPRRIDRLASGLPSTDRRAAGLQMVRAVGLTGIVRPASEHTTEAIGATRVLPVLSELRALLPGGGLRRGATISVRSSSVLLALLVAASKAGSWCAVVGMPALSPVAAAEMGIALDRLALVPDPGTEWTTTVAALLDGLDIVVAAPPSGPIAPAVAGRLAARARQRGSVLMPSGPWAGADLIVEPVRGVWEGLGAGRGRLRCRELTIQARGRGAAAAPREVTLWLPAAVGALPSLGEGEERIPRLRGKTEHTEHEVGASSDTGNVVPLRKGRAGSRPGTTDLRRPAVVPDGAWPAPRLDEMDRTGTS